MINHIYFLIPIRIQSLKNPERLKINIAMPWLTTTAQNYDFARYFNLSTFGSYDISLQLSQDLFCGLVEFP